MLSSTTEPNECQWPPINISTWTTNMKSITCKKSNNNIANSLSFFLFFFSFLASLCIVLWQSKMCHAQQNQIHCNLMVKFHWKHFYLAVSIPRLENFLQYSLVCTYHFHPSTFLQLLFLFCVQISIIFLPYKIISSMKWCNNAFSIPLLAHFLCQLLVFIVSLNLKCINKGKFLSKWKRQAKHTSKRERERVRCWSQQCHQ